MMLEWKQDTGTERGAYADWEAEQWPDQSHERFWPVFLEGPRVETTAHLDEVLRAVDEVLRAEHLLPKAEADWLATVRGLVHEGNWTGPLRTVVAVAERDYAHLPKSWTIRHVGPPLALHPHPFVPPTPRPIVAPAGEMVLPPIVAVIDDSIGYLNRRFRRASNRTRIELLWQQNAELADNPSGSVSFGRVLTKADINRLIAEDRDETEVYAEDADKLSPVLHPKIMRRRTSHGTAVLDLAAGGTPGEEYWELVRHMPILAVQLPTFAVTDTSGRRLEPYVAQGLSWVVTEAMRLPGAPRRRRPLIVNLSLGALAGPGDDTAFLAALINDEVERFERFTGAPMRVTAAYGNSRRGRLVGRAKVSASEPLEVEWRVQADDLTSSFLELRAPAAAASHLSLALTEPGEGTASLHLPCWPKPGERHRAFSSGQVTPCALVTGGDEGDFHTVLIALAPTEPNVGGVSVRPGGWKLCVRRTEQEEIRLQQDGTLVTLRVQRDDTPLGHWTRGRQSWLDHARGRIWSDDTKDWLDPADGNPVTYQGTAVDYAGATAEEALFVGSAFPKVGEYCKAFTVAGFSAEGATSPLRRGGESLRRGGESTGPDLLAQSEDGRFLRGRRVSGMASGTVARFGGTSMAAPMVARRLAVAFARHKGKLSDDEQWAALCGEGVRRRRWDPHEGRGYLSVDCPSDIA